MIEQIVKTSSQSVRPYTIKPGDTLLGIARQELGDAKRWVEIKKEDGSTFTEAEAGLIQIGQIIYLPITFRPYTIQSGDTLLAIAERELGEAKRWVEIKKEDGSTFSEAEASLIQIGQIIYLPDAENTVESPFDLERIFVIVPSHLKSYANKSIPLIIAEAKQNEVEDIAHIAYIIATAEHESHLGRWMEELADGSQYEGRKDLGNIRRGDGRLFKGRGYVQITGRSNYQLWSDSLGIDLVANPKRAAEPEIAAKILVQGMRDGSFTGVKLSNYINTAKRDFKNARRVINGLDQASKIARTAEGYLKVLG
ncbi:MAG: LysM peptidoglycan-binding domain-containing protein [Coleofasciculaceae cyanobacterium]